LTYLCIAVNLLLSMNSKRIVFAIIPCLNEARFIADLVGRAAKYVDEVLVVDDGSSDNTSDIARHAGATVLRHDTSMGAGAATRTGFQESLRRGATAVVTLDGDGQHNPDEIPGLLEAIQKGTADMVIGSRFLCKADVPIYRKFGIDVITWLYNLGAREKIVDGQSGFRAYSRKALEGINITYPGFGFSIQSLVQVRRANMKIVELPVSCIYHDAGSTQDPITHGLSVAWAVVKIRMEEEFFRPHRDPSK
jgi:glycosyltransferase involved in cell wall biosynthesis